MRKYLQLSIPEPCHEDWDKMTNIDKGKFCNACQKNVIDFTTMSDEQLIAFFRKPATGSTCGRFAEEQLDRNIEIPGKRIPWIKYFFQFALPAFLTIAKAKAQGEVVSKPVTITNHDSKKPMGDTIFVTSIQSINGQVTDENGTGIPYATIEVSDRSAIAITDSSGKFSIQVLRDIKPDLHLQVSSVGFETKEILLSELSNARYNKDLNIKLKHQVRKLDEVVVRADVHHRLGGFTGGVTITRVCYIDTVKKWLWRERQPATIYPNPVQRGATLNIKLDVKTGKEYNLVITSSDGKQVFTKKVFVNSKNQVENIPVNAAFASGIYFATIYDTRNKIVYSGKVVVF